MSCGSRRERTASPPAAQAVVGVRAALMNLRRRWWALLALALIVCLALGAWVYNLPSFQERFGWRISEARAAVFYALFPPEESVFTPNPTLAAMVQQTLAAFTPTPTVDPKPADRPPRRPPPRPPP